MMIYYNGLGSSNPFDEKVETFFSLGEWLGGANSFYQSDANAATNVLTYLLNLGDGFSVPSNLTSGDSGQQVDDLLRKFVLPQNWGFFLPSVPGSFDTLQDADGDVLQEIFDVWLGKLVSVITSTLEHYGPIVRFYKAEESKLMDDVKSTTERFNRFNDTPQNGGDFSDDGHTTTVSAEMIENKSAIDTLMGRLSQIRERWESVNQAWANEFYQLFIKGY